MTTGGVCLVHGRFNGSRCVVCVERERRVAQRRRDRIDRVRRLLRWL